MTKILADWHMMDRGDRTVCVIIAGMIVACVSITLGLLWPYLHHFGRLFNG